MVDRVVVGAHYGLRDWLIQRVSAVVMAVYCLFLAVYLSVQPRLDYDLWAGLFSGLWLRTFTLLFLLGMFYHAWVGMRDIAMDYVKPAGIRLSIYVLVILLLLVYVIWSVQILWGI